MAFTLTSSAFEDGGMIPREFTCDGEDLAPPLAWSNAPEGTRSFAIIMEGPDAVRGTFTHWLLHDIRATTTVLWEQTSAKHCATASVRPTTAGHAPHLMTGRIDMSSRSMLSMCPPSTCTTELDRRSSAHSTRTRWPRPS